MANQPLEFWLREKACQAARTLDGAQSAVRRVSPLHPGVMQLAPDFNPQANLSRIQLPAASQPITS